MIFSFTCYFRMQCLHKCPGWMFHLLTFGWLSQCATTWQMSLKGLQTLLEENECLINTKCIPRRWSCHVQGWVDMIYYYRSVNPGCEKQNSSSIKLHVSSFGSKWPTCGCFHMQFSRKHHCSKDPYVKIYYSTEDSQTVRQTVRQSLFYMEDN